MTQKKTEKLAKRADALRNNLKRRKEKEKSAKSEKVKPDPKENA